MSEGMLSKHGLTLVVIILSYYLLGINKRLEVCVFMCVYVWSHVCVPVCFEIKMYFSCSTNGKQV